MYISLDLETTGFDSEKDQIIEFGAIKFDLDGNSETLSFLINPQREIPEVVSYITNIYDKDVADADLFEDRKQEIIDFVGDLPIIGHNIQFDTTFLKAKGIPLTNPEYDTQVLSGILLPQMPSYSLEVISEELGLTHEDKHRALDDAIAAQLLFLHQCQAFQNLSEEEKNKIIRQSDKGSWAGKQLWHDLINHGVVKKIKHHSPVKKNFKAQKNNAKQILKADDRSAIEETPPFDNLLTDLAKKANNETYISLPNKTFNELETFLPDSVAQIDSPSQYISLEKLKKFEQKTNYKVEEITALLKVYNWLKQTTTGLIHELPIYGKEKALVEQLRVEDPNEIESNQFLKQALNKDKNAPAVCTHKYLCDKTFVGKSELIVFDVQSLVRAMRKNLSTYFKLIMLEEVISELKESCTEETAEKLNQIQESYHVLFGMLGGIMDKYQPIESQYTVRQNIEQEVRDEYLWKQVCTVAQKIINQASELKDLSKETNNHSLKQFKKQLTQIHGFFIKPDISRRLSWLERLPESGDIVVRSMPTNTEDLLEDKFREFKKVIIVDENLEFNDDLPESFEIIDFSQPAKNITLNYPEGINNKNSEEVTNFISNLRKNHKRIAVVFNSKRALKDVTLLLHSNGESVLSQLTGSKANYFANSKNIKVN